MSTFNDWDFFNKHVQSGLTPGQFISSQTCLICAGPPSLMSSSGAEDGVTALGEKVYPVGLISQWSLNQQMAAVPIAEAGSYRRYTVTGPTDCSVQMSRVLYHGPSIMRVLQAAASAPDERGVVVNPLIAPEAANYPRNPHNRISDSPGHENLYINLASSLFSQPIGLMFFIADINREQYGAFYLEGCYVPQHGISSGPGNLVIAETVAVNATRLRPITLPPSTVIPLLSKFNDSGKITTAGTMTGGVQSLNAPMSDNL